MLNLKTRKCNTFHRGFYAALISLLCIVALVFGMTLKKESVSAATQTKDIAIAGVELRADTGSNQYYLVLKTNEYAEVPVNTSVCNRKAIIR